jgi:hypothetical protein
LKLEIFIQANNKQLIGAKVAQAAIMRNSKILPQILNVDRMEGLGLENLNYKRGGNWVRLNANDLQSFTLVRFLPPTLMNFEGFSLVIDPDIFALQDLSDLFNLIETEDFSVLACEKKGFFDSSVMLINNSNFSEEYAWENIVEKLKIGSLDYLDLMSLNLYNIKVKKLERRFNSLDEISNDTVFLHTTNRLTQPWKTGLKIDFTRNNPGKYLNLVPKKVILKILGKYPSRYIRHPNPEIEKLFFKLANQAIKEGYLSEEEINQAIQARIVRRDFFKFINE